MKTKPELKRRATKLRRDGLSYNEIRREIPIAKSTLSLWLKHIPLAKKHRDRLYTKQIQILVRGPQCQKERRSREIEKILEGAGNEISVPLSPETYRLFGAALYWAEGSKGKDFAVTNSDPHLILFMVNWCERIFAVKPEQLKANLNIYEQQDENKIKKFWSELCGIPLKNFGKSYIKPTSKGYKKNNLYYGTIKVRVPRGTNLRWRVFGWTRKVMKEIQPRMDQTVHRWERLKKVQRIANLEHIRP